MHYRRALWLLLWVLFLAMPVTVCAQGLGRITGIVKDTSGAVIPGVNISITNQNTGIRVTVKSQTDGGYRTPQLNPGIYTISAEQPGFKKLDTTGVKLDVETTLTELSSQFTAKMLKRTEKTIAKARTVRAPTPGVSSRSAKPLGPRSAAAAKFPWSRRAIRSLARTS